MDNILDAMQSVTALASVGVGISNLFGIDDADFKDTMQKFASLSLIMQGIEKIQLQIQERQGIFGSFFAEIGDGCYIEPPLHANWGGKHCHLGKNVYFNFNVTLVDDTHIYVGDYSKFGPNVVIATAGHPILPELREKAYQYNAPVKIGKCVWLGAGVIVLPGVEIGDNCVIGAGSVVTKNIPANCVAVGNPCRVIREINDHDKEYYFKQRKIEL
jgi:galactoside O-acetyltransferase